MATGKEFSALLQVLAGEQQIIQRTDQKAFTLLSILGVFMVFFIVHFPKIQLTLAKFLYPGPIDCVIPNLFFSQALK